MTHALRERNDHAGQSHTVSLPEHCGTGRELLVGQSNQIMVFRFGDCGGNDPSMPEPSYVWVPWLVQRSEKVQKAQSCLLGRHSRCASNRACTLAIGFFRRCDRPRGSTCQAQHDRKPVRLPHPLRRIQVCREPEAARNADDLTISTSLT